jgi:hypothetical protein
MQQRKSTTINIALAILNWSSHIVNGYSMRNKTRNPRVSHVVLSGFKQQHII